MLIGKLFFVTVLVLSVVPSPGWAEAPAESSVTAPSAERVVLTYLDWFFAKTNGKQLREARQYVPQVVAAAQAERLDPLLLAVVISCESSWRAAAVGGIGEVGLMQVHGEAAKGFDVATVEGNLAAGAHWLASRIAKFGSLEAGMVAYMGSSDRAKKAASWRVKAYRAEQARQGIKSL